MRKLSVAASVLVVVWLLFVAGVYWAMRQPPDRFGRVMKRMPRQAMLALPFETLWNHARGGRLQPGDPAPDFTLSTAGHRSLPVRLSQHRGERPVVLVFGSYT